MLDHSGSSFRGTGYDGEACVIYYRLSFHDRAKQNKDINASLHYTLSEEQITVSQGEQEACVKWYDVRKCIYTAKALYLYMSPVRAFIFPADQCGDSFEQIRACVEERLGYYKDYDPSQEAETKQEDPK